MHRYTVSQKFNNLWWRAAYCWGWEGKSWHIVFLFFIRSLTLIIGNLDIFHFRNPHRWHWTSEALSHVLCAWVGLCLHLDPDRCPWIFQTVCRKEKLQLPEWTIHTVNLICQRYSWIQAGRKLSQKQISSLSQLFSFLRRKEIWVFAFEAVKWGIISDLSCAVQMYD